MKDWKYLLRSYVLIKHSNKNKITHFQAPTIIQDGGSFTMRGEILKIFHVAKKHCVCLQILAKMVTITHRSKW